MRKPPQGGLLCVCGGEVAHRFCGIVQNRLQSSAKIRFSKIRTLFTSGCALPGNRSKYGLSASAHYCEWAHWGCSNPVSLPEHFSIASAFTPLHLAARVGEGVIFPLMDLSPSAVDGRLPINDAQPWIALNSLRFRF